MFYLPAKNKKILTKNIQQYKKLHFSGKGSGVRLAEEVGVAPQTVSNWLSGRRLPTLTQIFRLAKEFEISPLKLCGVRDKYVYSRQFAHLTIFHTIIRYQEHMLNCNANHHITKKFLYELKFILKEELGKT